MRSIARCTAAVAATLLIALPAGAQAPPVPVAPTAPTAPAAPTSPAASTAEPTREEAINLGRATFKRAFAGD
ncbi:MAG: hypothetical protein ACYC0B_10250, partial [Gemmatimonadaceae bacterium]